MKKIFLISLIIIAVISTVVYGQKVYGYRKPINERSVPKIVNKSFIDRNPDAHVLGWYSTHITYWQNDYSAGWYYDWYGNRSVVIYTYENPNYYEVDFLDTEGNDSRSIFDTYGYWYETRTKINELPFPITNVIKSTKYLDWNISPLKEKIESPRWPTLYRFHTYKGKKSRIIRMDIEGNIIQAKYLND